MSLGRLLILAAAICLVLAILGLTKVIAVSAVPFFILAGVLLLVALFLEHRGPGTRTGL